MRSVAEDDDAQRDGEGEDVHAEGHLGPAPGGRLQEAVAEDHDVYCHVGHGAPEAQRRHVMQILEEGARDEQHTNDHHPRAGVDGAVRKRPHLLKNRMKLSLEIEKNELPTMRSPQRTT